jgi:hypothetical protein
MKLTIGGKYQYWYITATDWEYMGIICNDRCSDCRRKQPVLHHFRRDNSDNTSPSDLYLGSECAKEMQLVV